jgi:hypothetical protein
MHEQPLMRPQNVDVLPVSAVVQTQLWGPQIVSEMDTEMPERSGERGSSAAVHSQKTDPERIAHRIAEHDGHVSTRR